MTDRKATDDLGRIPRITVEDILNALNQEFAHFTALPMNATDSLYTCLSRIAVKLDAKARDA